MDHSQARQCAERFEFNRPEFYYTSSTTNDGSYSSSNIARSPDSPESPESPPNEASTSTEEFNNHTATVPQDNPHSTVTIGPNQFNCTQAATFSRIDTNDRVPASAARAVGARATNEYSFRPPSPPHFAVPPPNEDKQIALPKFVGFEGQRDVDVLRQITQGNFKVEAKEWLYPMRRQAQPVLAFLYLGPASVARDLNFLKAEGITMMMAVRDTKSGQKGFFNGKMVREELGIPTTYLDVSGNQELIKRFPEAIMAINDHLVEQFHTQGGLAKPAGPRANLDAPQTWGKILVFCESGNERSPTVVAAYLMAMYGLSILDALQYVQQQRFCVAFDDALKFLLRTYADILVAGGRPELSTASRQMSNDTGEAARKSATKRGRDEIMHDDEMMDVDEADDADRFQGRAAFTPFV